MATIKQQRYFFELSDSLGYNKEEIKNFAKKKYGKEHFLELTTAELSPLIKTLEAECYSMPKKEENNTKDFPDEFRAWNKEEKKMYYFSFEYAIGQGGYVSNQNIHYMQWTGRKDIKGAKIFDFDFVESSTGRKFLVQWGWDDCAWIAVHEDNKDRMFLGALGEVRRMGSVYEDIK